MPPNKTLESEMSRALQISGTIDYDSLLNLLLTELQPNDMFNLVQEQEQTYVLSVYDVRLSETLHQKLDNLQVLFRKPACLLKQAVTLTLTPIPECSLCDTIVVFNTCGDSSTFLDSFLFYGQIHLVKAFASVCLIVFYDSRSALSAFNNLCGPNFNLRLVNLTNCASISDLGSEQTFLAALDKSCTMMMDSCAQPSSFVSFDRQERYGTKGAREDPPAPILATTTSNSSRSKFRKSDKRFTFMIRNIPNKYTQDQLLEVLDSFLMRGQDYDFLYLRIDFINKYAFTLTIYRCNVGYAFINFTNSDAVQRFIGERVGKRWPLFNSEKICNLSFAHIQGRDTLIEKFRDSSIMLEQVGFRPKLFGSDGNEVPFPRALNYRPKSHDLYTRQRAALGLKNDCNDAEQVPIKDSASAVVPKQNNKLKSKFASYSKEEPGKAVMTDDNGSKGNVGNNPHDNKENLFWTSK